MFWKSGALTGPVWDEPVWTRAPDLQNIKILSYCDSSRFWQQNIEIIETVLGFGRILIVNARNLFEN